MDGLQRSANGSTSHEACSCRGFQAGSTDHSEGISVEDWRSRLPAGIVSNADGTTKTFSKPTDPDRSPEEASRSVGFLKHHACLVCGYPKLKEAPRDEESASYEICPSCGFQFGVSDDDRHYTYQWWRQEWLEKGMPWCSRGRAEPDGWDPRRQLENLGRQPGSGT